MEVMTDYTHISAIILLHDERTDGGMKKEFCSSDEMLIPYGSDSVGLIDGHSILVVRCYHELGKLVTAISQLFADVR